MSTEGATLRLHHSVCQVGAHCTLHSLPGRSSGSIERCRDGDVDMD